MPELPEVETMRRGAARVVGRRIEAVDLPPCPRKPILIQPGLAALRRRAVGARIDAADRVGKRVALRLDTGDALVFEPRMTGLVLLADPPDPIYLRFRLGLAGRGPRQLFYWDRRGLGNVRLLSPPQFAAAFAAEKLGPDALDMTADLYCERLGKSARAIKVALLDQRAVAGIGNLYAAEILHTAGVHPQKRCRTLTGREWEAVAVAAVEVLETAIRYEGSTLSDGTYKNALANSGRYQNEHRVYDREDEPCYRCGDPIRRIVQAQRATFFCAGCQPRSARGRRTIR